MIYHRGVRTLYTQLHHKHNRLDKVEMDERAAVPVTLPRDNPTQSYWQPDVDEIADLRSTESLPAEADTVIIGSGITGAAVAFNLLSNGAQDVVMVEARRACSGATGRNGIISTFSISSPTYLTPASPSHIGTAFELIVRGLLQKQAATQKRRHT